jgi:mannose-6-phosphate isomerase-like protein (cupin superfamily)
VQLNAAKCDGQAETPHTPASLRKLIYWSSLSKDVRDLLETHILGTIRQFAQQDPLPKIYIMLSILAGGHPVRRTNTASQKSVSYEDGRASQEFHATDESKYLLTLTVPPKGTPSAFNPPLHFHTSQLETFTVRKGLGYYFINTNSCVPDVMNPYIVKVGESINIPVGAYHRFESGDPEIELVVDILLNPDTRDIEHRFFRNFFGYET